MDIPRFDLWYFFNLPIKLEGEYHGEGMMDSTIKGSQKPKILALIPAFNESDHIAGVIKAVLPFAPVLVVDDGSRDNTSQIASDCGAQVLRQEPNQGKGAALLNGFKYALQNDYDGVITLDADGQHDPAEIPDFVNCFVETKSDLIIGRRDFCKMPFPRNISNTIGTWLFSRAMQQYIPDNQSGYRLHSRRLVEAAITSREQGFEFEVEIILRAVLMGYTISWVPIQTIYAGEKSHIQPLRHMWHFFRITARTRRIVREHSSL
jgi:glycosyltransferase involved in cell wall biosynthesis